MTINNFVYCNGEEHAPNRGTVGYNSTLLNVCAFYCLTSCLICVIRCHSSGFRESGNRCIGVLFIIEHLEIPSASNNGNI